MKYFIYKEKDFEPDLLKEHGFAFDDDKEMWVSEDPPWEDRAELHRLGVISVTEGWHNTMMKNVDEEAEARRRRFFSHRKRR